MYVSKIKIILTKTNILMISKNYIQERLQKWVRMPEDVKNVTDVDRTFCHMYSYVPIFIELLTINICSIIISAKRNRPRRLGADSVNKFIGQFPENDVVKIICLVLVFFVVVVRLVTVNQHKQGSNIKTVFTQCLQKRRLISDVR